MNKNLTVDFKTASLDPLDEESIRISTITSREWIVMDAGGAKVPMKINDLKEAIKEIEEFNVNT